jgi:hypothetical protein
MKTDLNVEPATAMELARATRSPLRKLYYWTLHWAGTRFATPMLSIISFAEASFFPIPPDALLLPMCFAKPRKWWIYAFWCTLFSVLGAIAGWLIGLYLWDATKEFFFRWIPGFTPAKFDSMAGLYQQYDPIQDHHHQRRRLPRLDLASHCRLHHQPRRALLRPRAAGAHLRRSRASVHRKISHLGAPRLPGGADSRNLRVEIPAALSR